MKPAQVSVDAMRLVTRALEQGRIYTVNSEVTNQLGSSQSSGNGKPHIPPEFYITFILQRPDLLNVLLLRPGWSKFFHFQKKLKFDHMIELIYTHMRFVTNGSFVAQRGSRFKLHCAIQVQNH